MLLLFQCNLGSAGYLKIGLVSKMVSYNLYDIGAENEAKLSYVKHKIVFLQCLFVMLRQTSGIFKVTRVSNVVSKLPKTA